MQNIFKDKSGNIIIVQKPNLPIIVWFVSFMLSLLQFPETVMKLLDAISFGALFTWAWMEIFSGVNIFRRLLGTGVLIGLLYLKTTGS